ncbi:hypothetical protein [Halobacteriovorax sp. JY17]|uniref:hypothetical protein n=1 Tax=Halobacteriovorax sp. JY17 TaxID=2014617 RepID=UPI000C43E7D2|nr:hypothetical protein [Halobacteriovorax sp. JY17]PIK15332.1 MAG: hypothetical protein CES88_01055 [Halobacteriovorax sp. JY17]
MKIIFYSTDKSVEKFFSSIEVDDSFLCASLDELETHLSDEKQSVIFLDFDCDELECSSLSNELASIETINTVLISKKMSLKEILEFQNSEDACDAYLAKPLAVEVLNGVINDFEIALSSANDSGESVDSGSSNVDLTFVGVKKDLLEQLDNIEVEEEDSEEDEEEIDFKASTLQVASEVRDVIDSHKSNGTNFDNVVNDEIQRKFDAVFERVNHSDLESVKEEFNITPQGFDSEEVETINDDGISFDLGSEDSTQDDAAREEHSEVAESAKDPLVEVKMSDDKEEDVGLEFNIPDSESPSDDSVNLAEDQSDDLSFSQEEDEIEGGLEFNLGSDEETATDITEGENSDDLDFSEETSGGLDLSVNEEDFSAADNSVEEDTGLSFDDEDSSDDLLIGEGEDSSRSSNIDEEDGLSFDDDEDEGLNLNESYETESENIEVSSNDDLDFSANEEDSGVDFSDVEATDPSYETGMGSDTSSDIESTISSIVAPSTSDENSTGEFDLSNIANDVIDDEEEEMQEFDYKTSGFSTSALIEDDDFGDIDDSLGDDTNPTIVASTSTLTTSDFMAQSGEDLSDDSFDEAEELSFSDETGTNEIESNLSPDNTGETVVADMLKNEVEEVSYAETNTPKVENIARSYDEDEMLRLQGTIRQLREERESLMNSINSLTSEKQLLSQDNLGLKAELDEVKIELEIVKKRSHDEVSEMKYQMNLSHEKKDVYEMKYKSLYKEFDRLNQKVRIDFNQVKQREKELESKLELVVMDSDSQVQTRDMKILELKRKIDSLEFNMENSSIREQKHREDKSKLEERLAKIMKTLRGSIQLIEDDLEVLETDNTTDLDKN